jgi:hypothetical protein
MALMAESGCLEQVDRGADNPTLYYTNYHETRKGGQGPVRAVAPVIIILFKEEKFCNFNKVKLNANLKLALCVFVPP